MSKPKRVHDPLELEAMIDRLKQLKITRMSRAAELDAKADEYFKLYGGWLEKLLPTQVEQIAISMRQLQRAKTWRTHAERLRNFHSTDKRLHYFSQKLAELRTDTFPGMVPDNSVSV